MTNILAAERFAAHFLMTHPPISKNVRIDSILFGREHISCPRRAESGRGEWVCLEQMTGVKEIGKANGELAAWIDGELYLHMTGFRGGQAPMSASSAFDVGIYIYQARRSNTAMTTWFSAPGTLGRLERRAEPLFASLVIRPIS